MIDELTMRKAVAGCWRRQTLKPDGSVRQKAGCLDWLLTEKMAGKGRVVVTPEDGATVPTADWRKAPEGGAFVHYIRVSDKIDEVFSKDPDDPVAGAELTDAEKIQLVRSVVAHEASHGAYTDGQRDVVQAKLAELKLRFRFHNLAEDCRIEWKYLKERGKAHKFGWTRLRKIPDKPTSCASTFLWMLKSREPALFKSTRAAAAPLAPRWEGLATIPSGKYGGQRTVQVIRNFYDRFAKAESELDIIPIEREWVDVFGHDVETITGVGDGDECSAGETPAGSGDSKGEAPAGEVTMKASKGRSSADQMSVATGFKYSGDIPFDPTEAIEGLAALKVFMHQDH